MMDCVRDKMRRVVRFLRDTGKSLRNTLARATDAVRSAFTSVKNYFKRDNDISEFGVSTAHVRNLGVALPVQRSRHINRQTSKQQVKFAIIFLHFAYICIMSVYKFD